MPEYTVLIVDDDAFSVHALRRCLEQSAYTVLEAKSAAECCSTLQSVRPDAVVLEYHLPDGEALRLLRQVRALDAAIPVILMSAHATIDLAVRAVKQGAEHFLAKPVEPAVLFNLLSESLQDRIASPAMPVETAAVGKGKPNPFIGSSLAIRTLAESARRILGTNCPILIEGETGTGKGVLARWLHEHGPRTEQPFVDLNCAGLNRELLESELFGHEKGAFTGAVSRKTGILEIAHRGTVLLDEIGDMDPAIQPKLLKVLEEKQFRRLGGVRECAVDVHLVAATNRDLNSLVAGHSFRSDLYFRVSTLPLRIPPLRERRQDIRALVAWFRPNLEADLNRGSLRIDDETFGALEEYDWPGNIRELRNVLERAALVCDRGVIRAGDLQFQAKPAAATVEDDSELTIEQLERTHIERVLRQVNGRVGEAAAKLGMSRSTLYVRIKQFGIPQANA